MLIKIQSISDIITNSSTEVFTMYNRSDLITIKNIVNAILAIDGNYTFDDFFNIDLLLNEYAVEDMYNDLEDLQEKFPTIDDFWNHLTSLSAEELEEYEDMYDDYRHYESYSTIYDCYNVTLKENIESTEKLETARRAINSLDNIFRHECQYC